MNASFARVHGAWAALGAFLRGFVGIGGGSLSSPGCQPSDDGHLHCGSDNAHATPASARAALLARAARRPSCC